MLSFRCFVGYLAVGRKHLGAPLVVPDNQWEQLVRRFRVTVPEGKKIMSIPIRGSRMLFNQDGPLLACADRVLEVPSGRVKILFNEEDINLHCISLDGRYVAGLTKSQKNEIVIWACDTQEGVVGLFGCGSCLSQQVVDHEFSNVTI